MAPLAEHEQSAASTLHAWDGALNLLDHPVLLVVAGTMTLTIWAANRTIHARRRRSQSWTSSNEKDIEHDHDHDQQSLSDLPPPLRSCLWQTRPSTSVYATTKTTSGTLAAQAPPSHEAHLTSNKASDPASTSPRGPWRRYSYPTTLADPNSPPTEITSDETKYFPIIDEDGNRRPGLWRRRTLVFEMSPTPNQYIVDTTTTTTDPTLDNDAVDVDGVENPPAPPRALGKLATTNMD